MIRLLIALLLLLSVGPICQAANPQPFLLGVGNAAFQVEGAPADSDWYRWTHAPGKIKDGTNADRGTEFWNRYEEDFRLARATGLNAFRLSLAWERIEPRPGVFDEAVLDHYAAILRSMRQHGLEPVVTLHHFVLPAWVAEKGGLVWDGFVSHFARYAAKVVGRLGAGDSRVSYWMTFNEPNVLVKMGYRDGNWPPGLRDEALATRAMAMLAYAHIVAVGRIRALNLPHVKVGIAHHWRVFQSHWRWNPVDWFLTSQIDDVWNHQFMRAVMTGRIHIAVPFGPSVKWRVPLPGNRPSLDYLGINNYGRLIVEPTLFSKEKFAIHEGPGVKSDLGWEVYAEGIVRSVKEASRYGLPLLISETGVADTSDRLRQALLREQFRGLEKLLTKGYRVFGYLHWSLTDNFEWAEGLSPRFGLVEMDYRTGERRPRPSLALYGELARRLRRRFPSVPHRP